MSKSRHGTYVYVKPWSERIVLLKLFVVWKRSIWQLLWQELLIFLALFAILSVIYRNGLTPYYPRLKFKFEFLVIFVSSVQKLIPLTFVLGFFVSIIMARWWSVIMLLPFLDQCVHYISSFIPNEITNKKKTTSTTRKEIESADDDNKAEHLRYLLMRYLNLSAALLLQSISIQAQRRFALTHHTILQQVGVRMMSFSKMLRIYSAVEKNGPTVRKKLENYNNDKEVKRTLGHLITEEEIRCFEDIAEKNGGQHVYDPEYWVPLQWSTRIINEAAKNGWIRKNAHLVHLTTLINSFRGRLGTIWCYSGFQFPLTYLQVVIIGIYTYFLCELLGRQFIDKSLGVKGKRIDNYIPFFSILQFLFYMGWFKMAYCFVYPLGESEADCPIAEIFDRNLRISNESGLAKDIIFPPYLQNGTNKPSEFLHEVMHNLVVKTPEELREDYNAKLSENKGP